MKVSVGVSNRHIHLTKEDYQVLCGCEPLEEARSLNQPGQFASNTYLTIKTEKATINHVRVLGPLRPYTQVEISRTDAYTLGIDPPINESGNLEGASMITIIGPFGAMTKEVAILANRHIHINHQDRVRLGLLNVSKVKVKIEGEKGGILDNVYIKEQEPSYFELHLDTDDANSHGLKNGDEVEIIL